MSGPPVRPNDQTTSRENVGDSCEGLSSWLSNVWDSISGPLNLRLIRDTEQVEFQAITLFPLVDLYDSELDDPGETPLEANSDGSIEGMDNITYTRNRNEVTISDDTGNTYTRTPEGQLFTSAAGQVFTYNEGENGTTATFSFGQHSDETEDDVTFTIDSRGRSMSTYFATFFSEDGQNITGYELKSGFYEEVGEDGVIRIRREGSGLVVATMNAISRSTTASYEESEAGGSDAGANSTETPIEDIQFTSEVTGEQVTVSTQDVPGSAVDLIIENENGRGWPLLVDLFDLVLSTSEIVMSRDGAILLFAGGLTVDEFGQVFLPSEETLRRIEELREFEEQRIEAQSQAVAANALALAHMAIGKINSGNFYSYDLGPIDAAFANLWSIIQHCNSLGISPPACVQGAYDAIMTARSGALIAAERDRACLAAGSTDPASRHRAQDPHVTLDYIRAGGLTPAGQVV